MDDDNKEFYVDICSRLRKLGAKLDLFGQVCEVTQSLPEDSVEIKNKETKIKLLETAKAE